MQQQTVYCMHKYYSYSWLHSIKNIVIKPYTLEVLVLQNLWIATVYKIASPNYLFAKPS